MSINIKGMRKTMENFRLDTMQNQKNLRGWGEKQRKDSKTLGKVEFRPKTRINQTKKDNLY